MPDADYFKHICTSVGMGLIGTDSALNILTWNQAASRLFSSEVGRRLSHGRNVVNIAPAERRTFVRQMFLRAVQRGIITEFELKIPTPRGKITLVFIVSPIRNDSGHITGASALIRNVTRRKKQEEQKKTKQRMDSLDKMAEGVAHNFNNILAGVSTYVDYALSSEEPQTMKEALRMTNQAINRASLITRALLEFAESATLETTREDVSKLLVQFVESKKEALQKQGIEVFLKTQPVPVLEVETARFERVLEHLTRNAAEAMPDGGRIIFDIFAEGTRLVIECTDTGEGISREYRDNIFDPFFSTRSVQSGGSSTSHVGLGLAVVHGIINELGGEVEMHTREGRGTTFRILLPIE